MRMIFAALLVFVSTPAFAWNGSISFSQEEKAAHAMGINKVISSSSACLKADLDRHQKFFQQYKISPFFGDRSSFSKLDREGKLGVVRQSMRNLGYSQNDIAQYATWMLDQMKPTSCVGLVLKCLEKGFRDAGQGAIWEKIRAYSNANDSDGTSVQNALHTLGWKVLYWNPWTDYNTRWDEQEVAKDPENTLRFWGYHEARWVSVQKKMKYFWNDVDDATTLVNFGRDVPASFKAVPFFVGTAHTGYHVFPGAYGQVVEGHSTRSITDSQTIESAPFNPLADGGAPRGSYWSGIIAVPPGFGL